VYRDMDAHNIVCSCAFMSNVCVRDFACVWLNRVIAFTCMCVCVCVCVLCGCTVFTCLCVDVLVCACVCMCMCMCMCVCVCVCVCVWLHCVYGHIYVAAGCSPE